MDIYLISEFKKRIKPFLFKMPDFSGNMINSVKKIKKNFMFAPNYLIGLFKLLSIGWSLICDKKKRANLPLFPIFLAGALLIFSPVANTKKTDLILQEKDFLPQELALLSENTLMPIYNVHDPDPKIVKSMSVIITAYSSTPWETWGNPFITAAGTNVREGIIANNLLPFGTRVKIPELYGEKIFVVEDRMHSRKGNYHFDIWFPSYQEALNFGAKRTYIQVLEG